MFNERACSFFFSFLDFLFLYIKNLYLFLIPTTKRQLAFLILFHLFFLCIYSSLSLQVSSSPSPQKMERPNSFLVNGGVKLPIGYRFLPTDEELVVHYLRRKAFGLPLPAFVIPEFDLFKSHPDSLPGDAREKNRYFFYRRKWNAYGNYRCKRPAGSGYWKHVGKERQVVASGTNQTVGIRRTLVFVEPKKPCNGTKTRWFMREYCLVSSAATPQVTGMESGDEWIVYKVYQRKRKGNGRKKSGINGVFVSPSCCIDYRMQADATDTGPPPPSPQSSSIVAPAFSNGLQDQEDEEISTCSRAS